MSKGTQLPRTSRVNEKIIEYYLKFGQERDLEKYMRLYSPCGQATDSRSRSTTTVSSCQSEDEGHIIRRLFHQDVRTAESVSDVGERVVPIDVETKEMFNISAKSKGDECTSSAPNLHTPPLRKQKSTKTKETQTPESVAKSHRRLEWDSLADVGYRKSLSTSNISILERSILKEYFNEISTSNSRKEKISTSSNLSKLKSKSEERKDMNKSNKSTKEHTINNNTTPLASSTMMDTNNSKENVKNRSRPKLVSKSTSMSIRRKYDQSAQTSVQRLPQLTSREVQVTLSSATSMTSSNAVGTATPSSFDYYSSRSNNSTADGEAAVKKLTMSAKKSQEPENQLHPFVEHINEMLQSHKVINSGECNNSGKFSGTSLQQMHDTLRKVLDENKENNTSSSSLLNSPQLDLGIQLLCSLIDARSLSKKQKRKLISDIVKRITTLNIEDDATADIERVVDLSSNIVSAQLCSRDYSRPDQKNIEASLKSTSTVKEARTAKTKDMSDLTHHLSSSNSVENAEGVIQIEVVKKHSAPTTSKKAASKLAEKNEKKLQPMSEGTRTEAQKQNILVSKSKELESYSKAATNENIILENNTDESSSASKTSTASKEPTTLKTFVNEANTDTSVTDLDVAAHASMREWLNPMTQSEIEYDEKKLEYARNADKCKINKVLDNENFDAEKKLQLKWIHAEIERLEILRCLLLKPNIERVNEADIKNRTDDTAKTHEMDNLYDTVCTDTKRSTVTTSTTYTPQQSSYDGGEPMQEIEVIIEESSENLVKLDGNLKRSKQRKRETQIVYDKPNDTKTVYNNFAAGKARFRTMTETVTTNEEQVLPTTTKSPVLPEQQQQRSKIDTPSCESHDAESVSSFAKQRKREFLEQYRNKKRLHYESLLHKQQQLLIQQQQTIIQELQQRCNAISHKATADATDRHYSVPHNINQAPCCACSNQHPQYHPAYFQLPSYNLRLRQPHIKAEKQPTRSHAPPCPPYAPCPPQPRPECIVAGGSSQKKHTIHSEQSTSSIFCISSEVSIPMSSSSVTSSTTTSTVNTIGIGVQTGNSLQRTQPIFGKRILYDSTQSKHSSNWVTYNPKPVRCGQSISIQVKPKSIAYVIQFDKKITTSTTTISTNTSTTTATSKNNSFSKIGPEADNNLGDDEQKPCALQDYLERAKPQFVAHTKERKAILNQIQALRLERGKELRDIIENASENSIDTRLQRLPPPATKRLRIFATKEMKAMTQRHCENLPEIVEKQERVREERRRHGNRMIRDIFNQRLQQRVHTGKLSLNHSRTII